MNKEGTILSLYKKWSWWVRKMKIKITNWEYWPMYIFYAPVSLYWLWLSIKARTPFFFSAANPKIKHAGFTLAKKSDIYDLIPTDYYPKTYLCRPRIKSDDLNQILAEKAFKFPLVVKPDIGERGAQVKLLYTAADLDQYNSKCKVDFLIQEFIDYEHEAGIFYYRIPGEEKGHISGIVSKEFLAVIGNGKSSIEMLLQKEDRFFLQLPVLKVTYGTFLNTVLPTGTRYILVPYGNHCRGAKFVDVSYKINDELVQTIDKLCQDIPGFNYGRMDVKFKSWEDLTQGKNFSIIELNGAVSEPTHIYDSNHAVFFAWKEVCRHWRLLYKISKLNAKAKNLKLMGTLEGVKMLKDHFNYLKLIK